MADYPPLSRYYIASYAANDRDFPVVAIRLDPRTAGYKVPEDLSSHPDSKRYPNHVFTGAQPSSGDQIVTHIYEILPSPWVPFTRYDDDLGPVQGRRRSVKNEGQVASLAADKRVNYEAREGSAIVYTEIEETWSIETDDDGNSLFPVRDRDFYDASRGSVQERRQLFVPTGEEEGTLENVNGVITQTSYEPYNEFLSVKIVETYSVDGPQLVGKATNNEGQLITVTTQRKAALNYIPPDPTATKTVEVSREDAESLVERVVDAPNVFDGRVLSASKPDVIPEAFRASVPAETTQETVAQTSVSMPSLEADDLEKSEQRVTEHTVRKTTTSRDNGLLPTLDGILYEEAFDVQIPYKEKIVSSVGEVGVSSEADPLSDDKILVREYDKDDIESYLDGFLETYPTTINLDLPRVLTDVRLDWDEEKRDGYSTNTPFFEGGITSGSFSDAEEIGSFHSATPIVNLDFKDVWGKNIPATVSIFFVRNPVTTATILAKVGASSWPVFKPTSHVITGVGATLRVSVKADVGLSIQQTDGLFGVIGSNSGNVQRDRSITPISITVPPSIHKSFKIQQTKILSLSPSVTAETPSIGGATYTTTVPSSTSSTSITNGAYIDIDIPATTIQDIPSSGIYLIDSNVEFFKYGFSIVKAVTINAGDLA